MKTYHCPLCGKKYEMHVGQNVYGDTTYFDFECNDCGYSVGTIEVSHDNDESGEVDKTMNKFLYKFPPIMRLKKGDVVEMDGKLCEVLSKPLIYGEVWLDVQESEIDKPEPYFAISEEIENYPWELEEERN